MPCPMDKGIRKMVKTRKADPAHKHCFRIPRCASAPQESDKDESWRISKTDLHNPRKGAGMLGGVAVLLPYFGGTRRADARLNPSSI